ncbi:uncharacterized protein Dwil_GK23098 [Drosophila willistoni]|uniref:MADF domain-containing protein n=1 Tax=Drosophila willistoni TaxID=7260 RepID=B4NME1_DROWI|nr:uncharacterized protein LOC6652324 [Drosophila willistoni]EDW85530.2 uncharacterized protein Dwil_GK23098 [Drosophila willistoni]
MKEMKVSRAISESSTTSDNTSDFIDIVKKYDVVYNNHNPDYKNVEVKMKVWAQIADEIGLSVEASKRKWKNLRDSYTKYLRSFRVGTKTSKKYQYWAHADHMEFLKPFQGPGRNSANGNAKSNDEDDTECDFGYQVLSKAASNSVEDDLKITISTASSDSVLITHTANTYTTSSNSTPILTPSIAKSMVPNVISPSNPITAVPLGPQILNTNSNSSLNSNCAAVAPLSSQTPPSTSNSSSNSAVVLPLPTATAVSKINANTFGHIPQIGLGVGSLTNQMFPLATLKAAAAAAGLPLPTSVALPGSNNSNNMGCLIIEPHLLAAADNFKKELSAAAAANAPLGLFQNLANQSAISINNRLNTCNNMNAIIPVLSQGDPPPTSLTAPPNSKVRRVQPSPQTTAINLSCTSGNSSSYHQPLPSKQRKVTDLREWDVSAVLQANRDLDANTLFFLSLARQVNAMPMKFQSLAKMRCMRIVSDLELELENFHCNDGAPPQDDCTVASDGSLNLKYFRSMDTPPPPIQDGSAIIIAPPHGATEGSTEHFVYVMSPSRVESMIDISSDEENTINSSCGVGPATTVGAT